MRKMKKEERKELEAYISKIMAGATGWEYARRILECKGDVDEDESENTFMEDVIDDVLSSSAWEDEGDYSDDDIRLAIGRTFMERLSVVY